jgi:hypothetical protein
MWVRVGHASAYLCGKSVGKWWRRGAYRRASSDGPLVLGSDAGAGAGAGTGANASVSGTSDGGGGACLRGAGTGMSAASGKPDAANSSACAEPRVSCT